MADTQFDQMDDVSVKIVMVEHFNALLSDAYRIELLNIYVDANVN